jgi:hypothetical protein
MMAITLLVEKFGVISLRVVRKINRWISRLLLIGRCAKKSKVLLDDKKIAHESIIKWDMVG